MRKLKLLVIIVNYNCFRETISCILNLVNNNYRDFDIFLVDNCSTDDSYENLKNWLENFKSNNVFLFRSEKNLGFAGGVNLGIKHALTENYDYVLLLNPDVIVEPDFLSKMLETANKSDDIGIVGCKILFFDRKRIFYAGGRISYFRNIGHNNYYGKINSNNIEGEIDTSFVTGCVMLIKTNLIREIGEFDEEYFMYLEDVDYCYRALRAGWRIKVNLDAVVYHKEGGSSNKSFAAYWASKNRLRFIFKHLRGFELIKAITLHFISKPFLYMKIRQWGVIKNDIKGFLDFFTKE